VFCWRYALENDVNFNLQADNMGTYSVTIATGCNGNNAVNFLSAILDETEHCVREAERDLVRASKHFPFHGQSQPLCIAKETWMLKSFIIDFFSQLQIKNQNHLFILKGHSQRVQRALCFRLANGGECVPVWVWRCHSSADGRATTPSCPPGGSVSSHHRQDAGCDGRRRGARYVLSVNSLLTSLSPAKGGGI